MSKRFIDTGFLDQKWIRKLSPEKKIFLIYLMLKCDNAGIIELDLEDAEFWIGKKITDLSFLPENYLIPLNGTCKYFMPKFIEWQYPNFPHSKVHQQVQAKDILIRNNIFNIDNECIDIPNIYLKVTQNLPNSQVHGNADGNADGNGNEKSINVSFENFWNLYDKKEDRVKCEVKWRNLKDCERELCIQSLPAYIKSTPDKKYRKNPATFLNNKSWDNEIIKSKQIAEFGLTDEPMLQVSKKYL
jgi:hypothetical protein